MGAQDIRTQAQIATDALNAEDFETLAAVFHPELEHRSIFAAVEGDVYLGIEGQRRRWANVKAAWDDFRIELVEVVEVGEDRAVVVLRLTGTAKSSGVPLDERLGQVWTWQEGKVRRIVSYADPRDAFDAVRRSDLSDR